MLCLKWHYSCKICSCADSHWTDCQFGSKLSIMCQIVQAKWLFVREVQEALSVSEKPQVSQLQGDQMTSFSTMTLGLWSLGLQSPLLFSAQVTANILTLSTQWGCCRPYKWIPLTSQKQRSNFLCNTLSHKGFSLKYDQIFNWNQRAKPWQPARNKIHGLEMLNIRCKRTMKLDWSKTMIWESESYSIIERTIKSLGVETGHLLIYDSNWWLKHSLQPQEKNLQLWRAEIYFKNFQWRDKMQLAESRTQSA